MSVNGPSEILTENCELLTESKEIPVQTAEDFNKEMAENASMSKLWGRFLICLF